LVASGGRGSSRAVNAKARASSARRRTCSSRCSAEYPNRRTGQSRLAACARYSSSAQSLARTRDRRRGVRKRFGSVARTSCRSADAEDGEGRTSGGECPVADSGQRNLYGGAVELDQFLAPNAHSKPAVGAPKANGPALRPGLFRQVREEDRSPKVKTLNEPIP